jgi:hypothetical protein
VSFNTKNNTYHLIKISKTTYEEQQERKEHIKYMIFQKFLGLVATVLSIILIFNGITPGLFLTVMGLALILTNDKAIG